MANKRYSPDQNGQTRAGTYADVGEPVPRQTSTQRYKTNDYTTIADDVEYILDDVEVTNVQYAQPVRRPRKQGNTTMIGHDQLPRRRHHTYTDPEIDESFIATAPSKRLVATRRGVRYYIGVASGIFVSAIVTVSLGWVYVVEPVVSHWHNGDSPVRSYQIRVNGKLCDVQASYLSSKVVVVITPQDINTPSAVLEVALHTNTNGGHVVTIAPSFDAAGNPDLQTYVDGVPGPAIVNDGHGLKMK